MFKYQNVKIKHQFKKILIYFAFKNNNTAFGNLKQIRI